MKLDIFDKHEWDCFHDCVFNATNKSNSLDELKVIFETLPQHIIDDGFSYSLSDSSVKYSNLLHFTF